MKFNSGNNKLRSGFLIKRYKRFLCDVRLENGEQITMHCPNTGSMKNCVFADALVWFSLSENKKRKYPYTWEMIENPEGEKIGINTRLANHLVLEAIENKCIKELQSYHSLQCEIKYGEESSRIDIRLEDKNFQYTYIEVKSVTLLEEDGWGYFPDSISKRGQKHLRELMWVVKQGHRAVLFFCVQHSGINKMKAAKHIDPIYAELLREAIDKGVEVLAYGCDLNEEGIVISKVVHFEP